MSVTIISQLMYSLWHQDSQKQNKQELCWMISSQKAARVIAWNMSSIFWLAYFSQSENW